MKKLLVKYTNDNGDSVILHDGEVTEIEWAEGSDSVRIAAKINSRKSSKSSNGSSTSLLEALTTAARNRNAAAVSEKRAEFNREKAESELEEAAAVAVVDGVVE